MPVRLETDKAMFLHYSPVMRYATCLCAILAALAVAGCVAPRPLVSPLPPQTLGKSITVRQQVTARFDGKVRTMQVALKVVPDDLTLIGLTAVGQRLFTLSWNGRQAKLKSTIGSLASMDPKRILADLQLACWPLSVLQAALPDDLSLQQVGTARLLWRDGKLLWLASSETKDRWHSTLVVYNVRMGYQLTIRPLAMGSSE